jgi:hypothetical protein
MPLRNEKVLSSAPSFPKLGSHGLCTGSYRVLGTLIYWEPVYTGNNPILGAIEYWELLYTGSYCVLGAIVYWELASTGSEGSN